MLRQFDQHCPHPLHLLSQGGVELHCNACGFAGRCRRLVPTDDHGVGDTRLLDGPDG